MKDSLINGTVAPGFEKVRETFIDNFKNKNEVGAACAVYINGELVVDLWGGHADVKKTRQWNKNTKVLVFSSTKGFSSLAFSLLHSKGLMDFDDKIVKYWPEFAQNGKSDITIRQLLAHEAGLMIVDKLLLLETLKNKDKLGDILASQKPFSNAIGKKAYHTWTISLYQSELVRRIDPLGRSIGTYFNDELAKVLDAEFFIGIPSNLNSNDIADVIPFNPLDTLFKKNRGVIPYNLLLNFLNPFGMAMRSFLNPPLAISPLFFNFRNIRELEIGSVTGIGTARGMAKIYGEFASGGKTLKINPTTISALQDFPYNINNEKIDMVLGEKLNFSLGLEKPSSYFNFGTNANAYGHQGAGGSAAFADPCQKLGFAYIMNRMGTSVANDPREKSLRDAVYKCI
jgi:CubicO group peptidase (beta-lactamase class C family)